MSDSRTDEQLACLAQAGCSEAFGLLVCRYQNRISHFLYRRVGHYHDAVDLAQETFLRAWRFRKTYRPKWRFSTWLFTIAYRLAAEHGRSARAPAATLDAVAEPAAQAPRPEEQVIAEEWKQNLWAVARRRLSDDQYQLLWLRYGEQFSIKQTARVTGRSAVSVKVQLMRARRTLSRSLKPIGQPQRSFAPNPSLSEPSPAGGAP